MVPVTFYYKMARSAQFKCFDEVVVDVCIHPRLLESVKRCTCGSARNEPRFHAAQRRVVELAVIPYPVTMAADEVWPRIAGGLRVHDEHRFTHLGLQCPVAGQP